MLVYLMLFSPQRGSLAIVEDASHVVWLMWLNIAIVDMAGYFAARANIFQSRSLAIATSCRQRLREISDAQYSANIIISEEGPDGMISMSALKAHGHDSPRRETARPPFTHAEYRGWPS